MFRSNGRRLDNKPAIIFCATCQRPVMHKYLARETGEDGNDDIFYRCQSCGAQRIWGTVENRPARWVEAALGGGTNVVH